MTISEEIRKGQVDGMPSMERTYKSCWICNLTFNRSFLTSARNTLISSLAQPLTWVKARSENPSRPSRSCNKSIEPISFCKHPELSARGISLQSKDQNE